MIKYSGLTGLIFIFIMSSVAFAQQKKAKVIDQVKTLFGPGNHLERTLQNVKTMEKQYIQEKMHVDAKTFDIIDNLKNPFIPQLPEKEEKQLPRPKPDKTKQPKRSAPKPQVVDDEPQLAKPKFSISGLVWNTDRPQAIINNQIYDVGDVIQQWTITEINKEGIEINFREQSYFIEK